MIKFLTIFAIIGLSFNLTACDKLTDKLNLSTIPLLEMYERDIENNLKVIDPSLKSDEDDFNHEESPRYSPRATAKKIKKAKKNIVKYQEAINDIIPQKLHLDYHNRSTNLTTWLFNKSDKEQKKIAKKSKKFISSHKKVKTYLKQLQELNDQKDLTA